MDRREALAALMSLPVATKISAVPAASDDVIVIEVEEKLSSDAALRIQETLQIVWPDRKAIILDNGIKLKLAPK